MLHKREEFDLDLSYKIAFSLKYCNLVYCNRTAPPHKSPPSNLGCFCLASHPWSRRWISPVPGRTPTNSSLPGCVVAFVQYFFCCKLPSQWQLIPYINLGMPSAQRVCWVWPSGMAVGSMGSVHCMVSRSFSPSKIIPYFSTSSSLPPPITFPIISCKFSYSKL